MRIRRTRGSRGELLSTGGRLEREARLDLLEEDPHGDIEAPDPAKVGPEPER